MKRSEKSAMAINAVSKINKMELNVLCNSIHLPLTGKEISEMTGFTLRFLVKHGIISRYKRSDFYYANTEEAQ